MIDVTGIGAANTFEVLTANVTRTSWFSFSFSLSIKQQVLYLRVFYFFAHRIKSAVHSNRLWAQELQRFKIRHCEQSSEISFWYCYVFYMRIDC